MKGEKRNLVFSTARDGTRTLAGLATNEKLRCRSVVTPIARQFKICFSLRFPDSFKTFASARRFFEKALIECNRKIRDTNILLR
jgi:hypothetical protein